MPRVTNPEHEPIEPAKKSKVRQVIKDRFDAIVAVGISAAIFSGAYFFRIAPQLNSLDEQMSGIGTQLTKVNKSLTALESNELFQLEVTSKDLMKRMNGVVTQTTALSGELAAATTVAAQVRADFDRLQATLAAYEAAVAAAGKPLEQLPDVRGNADTLAARLAAADAQLGPPGKAFPKLYAQAAALDARLDEAAKRLPAGKQKFPDLLAEAEALARRIDEVQAKLGTKKQPFPDVAAAARELQAELERVRKGLKGAVLVCSELKDAALLKQLRRKGYCK